MNPWNTKTEIELDIDRKIAIQEWYASLTSFPRGKRREALTSNPLSEIDREYLVDLYSNKGIGIKLLARAFDISYSRMRVILKNYVKLNLRTCQESTDFLKGIRRERILGDKNPWYDWPANKPFLSKTSSRGIQGYYTRRDGKTIWIRSSWEYRYASWLDQQKIDWKYEDYNFTLSNGETYRPDFLIYEAGILVKIVEIKGYFDNRRYKAEILKNDLMGKVDVVIIDNINDYGTEEDTKRWKQMCKSRERE